MDETYVRCIASRLVWAGAERQVACYLASRPCTCIYTFTYIPCCCVDVKEVGRHFAYLSVFRQEEATLRVLQAVATAAPRVEAVCSTAYDLRYDRSASEPT